VDGTVVGLTVYGVAGDNDDEPSVDESSFEESSFDGVTVVTVGSTTD
jgi:hypothetical protein